MKISARQYAASLMESISAQTDSALAVTLDNFFNILVENRDLNRLDEIINSFSNVWDETQGELAVKFTGARAISEETRVELKKYLQEKLAVSKIVLTENIDPQILGGFTLHYKDKVIDASLKQSLQELENEMNK